ncbi:tetratricopeptide repeat protein [Olsenella sp. Marseille-P4559]|uniref:tetratricopeptide repeat protein n=1 Tax=Olsenella sp. Marseille-P4559 TaxID=2364795 RepID=UPI001030E93C|nr:tetratricopeptide repeat protein [Olsenella sp. Marseille-P4559]
MNQQAYEAGKSAYQQGDWLTAVDRLSQAKNPGEVSGAVDHLVGNCYMKLGQYESAAAAYESALRDAAYGKIGPLSCNRGRALLAAGRPAEAVTALAQALSDASYATPYKAHMALGTAYERLGDPRNAGIAYRNAAIDESNPNPSSALCDLGSCFIQLGRPVDAVEAYRTALDFSAPLQSQNQIYCDLGLAYVAANRMSEAVDAFDHATADGTLALSPEAQASYDAARKAMAAITGKKRPSDTDALLAAAGYGGEYDPLDPTGASGELMPSADDTGFFSVSEEDLVEQDKKERKIRRKHNHRGLKVFIAILILLVVALGAAGYAYYRGYGWPTQEAVVEQLFDAKTSGTDLGSFLAASVPASDAGAIEATVPSGATIKSTEVDRSMTESTVTVTASLPSGESQTYTVSLVRDGISWKVTNVTSDVASAASTMTTTTTTTGTTTGTSTQG